MSNSISGKEQNRLPPTPKRQTHLSETANNTFRFISVDPNNAQEGRRNNQLAHSHIAKRQRLREASRRSLVSRRRTVPVARSGRGESSLASSTGGSENIEPVFPITRRASAGSPSPEGFQSDSRLLSQAGAIISAADAGTAPWASSNTSDYQSGTEHGAETWSGTESHCPQCDCDICAGISGFWSPSRTICPVLGAMRNITLDSASPSILAQTLDTSKNVELNLTFPKYSKPFDISSRLALFYEKPIVFHGFTDASAVRRDVVSNEPRLSRQQEIIAHHGKLIHLLNELLSDLQDSDLEHAILAVLLLTLADLEWHQLGNDRILPFRPHMASANWINVFGRVMSLNPNRFKEHINAMYTLVCRRGGLEYLQLPGLGVQVAYQDLIGASRYIEKPRFTCIWRLDDSVLSAIRKLQSPTLGVDSPGFGFRALVPEGLPPHALGTLIALSSIDSLMGECNTPSNIDHSSLVNARNTIQHQVLSLPAWEELGDAEREKFAPACYELCRLTGILYTTAIVFGMPPQTSWHLDLVQRIQQLLQITAFETWREEQSSLLIWSLLVSGIAAYRSPCRKWYESALQAVLQKSSLSSWSAVEKVVSQFLWSEVVCAHGAAVMWDTVDLGGDVLNSTVYEHDGWLYIKT